MSEDLIEYTNTFRQPVYSKWKCSLFGHDSMGICYYPVEGKEPCWFHRKMQELILGHRWTWEGK